MTAFNHENALADHVDEGNRELQLPVNDNNPNSQKENAVMTTTLPTDVNWHPHWCDPDQCLVDETGGIPRDSYHHSKETKVSYGSGGETIDVGTTLVINLDGDLNPGEEAIEGRISAVGYTLTIQEAEELALALLRAARAAERSVLALTAWPAVLDVVAEELDDYAGNVDQAAVARDVIDKWGSFGDVDELIDKVPPNEWWAIVRKHTEAVDDRDSVARYVDDAMREWGPSWSVDHVDAIADDLTRHYEDDAAEHARVRSAAFWDIAHRHVKGAVASDV